MADRSVVSVALKLSEHGVGHHDALHVASAMAGKADIFVATDDRLICRRAMEDVNRALDDLEAGRVIRAMIRVVE